MSSPLRSVEMWRDWSAIPTIPDIASRIPSDADYLNSRAVCSSWRSNSPIRPRPSLLLIVEQDTHSLGICKFPDLQISPSMLPDGILMDRFLCGSSRGWIALLDSSPAISLYNLVTGDFTQLPILHFDNESVSGLRVTKVGEALFNYCKAGETNYFYPQSFSDVDILLASKVVLSSDPLDEDCVVMALRYEGEKLIYCRPREGNSWNILSHPCEPHCLTDIIFYNGQFYGVYQYRVFVCNTGPGESGVYEISPATPRFSDGRAQRDYYPILSSYLVVSSQGLLLVTIQQPSKFYKIRNYICEVFRVDFVDGMLSLVKLESLGGRSLFLGPESTSLCAANAPGCIPNCIYFVHRPHLEMGKGDRVSVFNMEDGSTSCITSFPDVYSRAHWITSHLS